MQTKNWIIVNGLIDQGVALSEIVGIYPYDIGIILSATINPGGEIDDPKSERGIDPMPQVKNLGMNMPPILQLKLSVSVTAALYYENIGRPIIPSIMSLTRIR